MMTRLGLGLLLTLATGCGVQTNSPWMEPGQNCLECHNASPNAQAHGKVWSVGGTVFTDATSGQGLQEAQVLIVDARGVAVTLTSNGTGNFYTGEDLQAPFQYIAVRNTSTGTVTPMPLPVPVPSGKNPQDYVADGACNRCHVTGGVAGLPVLAPQ